MVDGVVRLVRRVLAAATGGLRVLATDHDGWGGESSAGVEGAASAAAAAAAAAGVAGRGYAGSGGATGSLAAANCGGRSRAGLSAGALFLLTPRVAPGGHLPGSGGVMPPPRRRAGRGGGGWHYHPTTASAAAATSEATRAARSREAAARVRRHLEVARRCARRALGRSQPGGPALQTLCRPEPPTGGCGGAARRRRRAAGWGLEPVWEE